MLVEKQFEMESVGQTLTYQSGVYLVLFFTTPKTFYRLVFNKEKQKLHQKILELDLALQMPLDIRGADLSITEMVDFEGGPVFKAQTPELTWFFALTENVLCPISMHQSPAWCLFKQVVFLADNKKLICDQS